MSVQATVWPRGLKRAKTSGPLGVTWSGESARIGRAVPATSIGKLVAASVSTRYEDGFGGEDLASFTIVPHGGFIGGMFRPGDHVRITSGGGNVGDVELSEVLPNADGTVDFKCRGYAYNLFEYDSIYNYDDGVSDDVAYPTTKLIASPTVANTKFGWEYAVDVLGMPINQIVGDRDGWTGYRGGSRVAEKPLKLASIITDNGREYGDRWAVWGRTLVIGAETTTAKWTYDSPAGLVGVADTDYATHVGVWYPARGPAFWSSGTTYSIGDKVEHEARWFVAIDGGGTNFNKNPATDTAYWDEIPVTRKPGDYEIAWAISTGSGINRFDTRTEVVDYRGLGRITSGRASTLASMLLAQVEGRFMINGGFTITPDSGFKSAGGGAAPIAFVRAGDGMRLTNQRTTQGNLMPGGGFHVIGKTEWSWRVDGNGVESEQNTITPMGAVPRNLGDILKGVPFESSRAIA